MNETHIKVKDEVRARIEREILEFQAKGHAITHILDGVGAYKLMTGPQYYKTMQACATEGNKIIRAKKLPVRT